MKKINLIWIIGMIFIINSLNVNAGYVLNNDTCDSPANWSIAGGATVSGGTCAIRGNGDILQYINKLPNMSTNSRNFSVFIYGWNATGGADGEKVGAFQSGNETGYPPSPDTRMYNILKYSPWCLTPVVCIRQNSGVADAKASIMGSDGTRQNITQFVFLMNVSVDVYVNKTYVGNVWQTAGHGNATTFKAASDGGVLNSFTGILVVNGSTESEPVTPSPDTTPPEMTLINLTSEAALKVVALP